MNWQLAKYEPLPFLPPWLYISLLVAFLVTWLLYSLFREKYKLQIEPFAIDVLTIWPLTGKRAKEIPEVQDFMAELTGPEQNFLQMNIDRFGNGGIIAGDSESTSVLTYFPVKFYENEDFGFEIEWLNRLSFIRPDFENLALVIDHAKLAERHFESDIFSSIIDGMIKIADELNFGKLVFWESVCGVIRPELVSECGHDPIVSEERFYLDIKKEEIKS